MTAGDHTAALLESGLALAQERSLPAVLRRIVTLAADVTGARYGALGVLGPDGWLEDFITTGVSAEQRAAIGPLPRGHGILGLLIRDARPLRLRDIAADPRAVGLPPHHPPMHSFLGAPVSAKGTVFGNIYLAEKQGAPEFTEADEAALTVLAGQAGVAVDNARANQEAALRERRLEAAGEVAAAILAGDEPDAVLAVVAARARQLGRTDLALAATPSPGGELIVQAADGAPELVGTRLPADATLPGGGPALALPLAANSGTLGVLVLANRPGGRELRPEDGEHVAAFAQQATVALEYARAQRELKRLAVLEDRERIAKELHDGAIQALFAVGMGLQASAVLARDDEVAGRIAQAVEDVDRVIRDLRNYIFGLRPALLADRRLDQAIRALVDEFAGRSGVTAVAEIDPQVASGLGGTAADVLQITREALSNVARHARAITCRVSLQREGDRAVLVIDDDGIGFAPGTATGGHGLGNLAERARDLGGLAEVESVPGEGTTVRISLPL
jgi:signal transduction histidine kinase